MAGSRIRDNNSIGGLIVTRIVWHDRRWTATCAQTLAAIRSYRRVPSGQPHAEACEADHQLNQAAYALFYKGMMTNRQGKRRMIA